MGKKTNKKKQISVAIIAIMLLSFVIGCKTVNNSGNTVGNPPASMKTVTQNGKENLITFEFQAPEDWMIAPKDLLSVIAYPKSAAQKVFDADVDALPLTVGISRIRLSEEDKQMYKDLFAGKTDTFEKHMNQKIALPKTPSYSKDYLDLLLPKEDNVSQESGEKLENFQYRYYDGTNGKITEVQYSDSYNGKTLHIVQCYREDTPYIITGAFDDSIDLSSGKIALWVADSLKVKEHFTIKDNVVRISP